MNNKLITLLVCSMLLLAALASFAAAAAEIVNVTGNQVTVNHGENFGVSFSIQNNNPEGDVKNITNIEINLPQLVSGTLPLKGSWTSAKLGQQTFSINNKVTLTGVKILNNSASSPIVLTFSTQRGAEPSVYSGQITLSAKFEEQETLTNAQIAPISLQLTVPSAPQLSFVQFNALTINQNTSFITLNNTGNILLERITLNVTGDLNLTLSQNEIASLAPNSGTSPIKVVADFSKLKFGANTATITATSTSGASASTQFSLTKTFCVNGHKTSNITIRGIEFIEFGDDEEEWKLLDELTIEVDIKNEGNEEVDDVIVQLGLFDENGEDLADELIFTNRDKEEFDLGDIKKGDIKTATFVFKVPADFNLGNYKLAFKAYSEREGEQNLCADISTDFGSANSYTSIKIKEETDEGKFIAFDNIKLSPTSDATCGDTITLTFDVVNIGDEDQDQVKIRLENSNLNLAQSLEIKNDLNRGEREKNLRFIFKVPQNLENKIYNLELTADYGYKKNRGEYADALDIPHTLPLKVIGCAAQPGTSKLANINVLPLDKVAKAGEEIIVTATITNVGTKNNTFVIGIKEYESWATLKATTERIISLAPGESREVKFTFEINKDAKGEHTFVIDAISSGVTESKTVRIILEEEEKVSPFSGFNLGSATLLWIVGIMNIILLVLIVIIAIKLSRR